MTKSMRRSSNCQRSALASSLCALVTLSWQALQLMNPCQALEQGRYFEQPFTPEGFELRKVYNETRKADASLDFIDADTLIVQLNGWRTIFAGDKPKLFSPLSALELLKGQTRKNLIVAWLPKFFPARISNQKQQMENFKAYMSSLGYKRVLILGRTSLGTDVIFDTSEPEERQKNFDSGPEIARTTLEDAFNASEWIGDCEYAKYESIGKISPCNPPVAIFSDWRVLKGPPFGHALPVIWEFDQFASQKDREAWKFSPDMMPKKGTHWIIFMPLAVPIQDRGFETYGGSFGRMEATAENLEAIARLIEQNHKKQ
ncbi:MAG: hypothetical protein JST01_06565 [Cyanobacteria bacterium SZAS TMP-1]|nr:hypothetical protein [Cyanobacteria bacterium SZAS TMP-1]